jgi:hypothetical protein
LAEFTANNNQGYQGVVIIASIQNSVWPGNGRAIDEIANANYDKLIAGYRKGLDETKLSFVKAV